MLRRTAAALTLTCVAAHSPLPSQGVLIGRVIYGSERDAEEGGEEDMAQGKGGADVDVEAPPSPRKGSCCATAAAQEEAAAMEHAPSAPPATRAASDCSGAYHALPTWSCA